VTINPVSAYSTQNVGSDFGRDGGFARRAMAASVITRDTGIKVGPLSVSFKTRSVALPPAPAPLSALSFAHELELAGLTRHVPPFLPAGIFSQNLTLQRLGAAAYENQAAAIRTAVAMINIVV
jgi:hypothetical protein